MNLFKKVFAVAAGLLVASLASAVVYYGFNPITGLNTTNGTAVSSGTLPVIDATTSCGTLATVQASLLGGASVFQVTANSAGGTCTVKFDFPSAAPNGFFCVAVDETTAAKTFTQTTHSTSSCTISAATVASSDNVLVEVNGF